jgi:hypothetical protein
MTRLLCALPLLLAACGTTSYMRDTQPKPAPAAGEAKVVVYRSASWGGGKHFPIYDATEGDGKLMGFTETDCYFEYVCPAGKRIFLTWGESNAYIEAELLPQKTYYIRAFSKFGVWSKRPGFEPVTKDTDWMRKLDEVFPTLRCRELDPEKAADYTGRKEDRLKKVQASYEEGKKAPLYLKPEDGR